MSKVDSKEKTELIAKILGLRLTYFEEIDLLETRYYVNVLSDINVPIHSCFKRKPYSDEKSFIRMFYDLDQSCIDYNSDGVNVLRYIEKNC